MRGVGAVFLGGPLARMAYGVDIMCTAHLSQPTTCICICIGTTTRLYVRMSYSAPAHLLAPALSSCCHASSYVILRVLPCWSVELERRAGA